MMTSPRSDDKANPMHHAHVQPVNHVFGHLWFRYDLAEGPTKEILDAIAESMDRARERGATNEILSAVAETTDKVRESLPNEGGDDAMRHEITNKVVARNQLQLATRGGLRAPDLRLDDSDIPPPPDSATLEACRAWRSSAASPRNDLERPLSTSLTVDCAVPIVAAISTCVSPALSRSRTMDAQRERGAEVFISENHRESEADCQVSDNRHPEAGLRHNVEMRRDPAKEAKLAAPEVLPGARVIYWREVRGMDQIELALKTGIPQSTLATLESGRTKFGKSLGEIAEKLGLHLKYLRTGKGPALLPDAEADEPPPATPDLPPLAMVPTQKDWPFPAVPLSHLARLHMDEMERIYVETKLLEAIQYIEGRRRGKRVG